MVVAVRFYFALELRQLGIAVLVGNQRGQGRVVRRGRSGQGSDGDPIPARGHAGGVAGVERVRAVLFNFAEGDLTVLAAAGVRAEDDEASVQRGAFVEDFAGDLVKRSWFVRTAGQHK